MYQGGIRDSIISADTDVISSLQKSNKSGRGFPLGNFVLLSLSSSKKGWVKASKGLNLLSGLYTKILEMRSIASGGVLDLKTLFQG